MKNGLTKYYQIFSSIPEGDYEKSIQFLKENISNLFLEDYYAQFPNSEILEFNVNGYSYLFDLHIETGSNKTEKDDRVVAVYGRISHANAKRDSNRMKGFIGPFTKLAKYKDFDKGHFVSHKINGGLDQNLYPQLKELNRGWSKQGKLFRSLERYCEQNPDAFLFTRPIYADLSWIPEFIDYGIFTKEFGLLLNRFNNKKMHAADK
ncbi:MAG: hypothetical protein HQ565_08615 [Bacteroidetes bacterium]|nr:hypothetical protein [Bacteroidota bacterium]